MRYRLFDFILESDVTFPELPLKSGRDPDLHLQQGGASAPSQPPRWFHTIAADEGEPWLSIGRGDEGYVLEFHERVTLDYRMSTVRWWRRTGVSDESFRHLLLDQALPLIAAQAGRTVLHGACAVRDGGAALFVGPAGSGKSTLVASLLAGGWRAAADDAATVVVQAHGARVRPSYGGLRLWSDSSEALGYPGDAGMPAGTDPDKRRFQVGSLPQQDLPLRAVYVLRPLEQNAASIRELSKRDAVIALVSNAYVLDIEDGRRARSQLDTLSAVAERVPVLELTVPHRFEMLHGVRALVEQRFPSEVVR